MEPKLEELAIKVMRLSRPSMQMFNRKGSSEMWDLASADISWEDQQDLNTSTQSSILSNRVLLPQSFGTIYLGETFQSYLRVQNILTQCVKNVSVQADLQTAAQRIQLTKKSLSSSQLEPLQSIDEIISHEITEIGTHILVCEVSYQVESQEPVTTSRYYKFQVLKPLDVKTKFYNAESDEVFLEAQIQNTTVDRPLCLEKVLLEPSSTFKACALNNVASHKNGGHPASTAVFCALVVQPGETRQYLYSLKPQNEERYPNHGLKGENNIGKLDLVWRTSVGERGRLQTSQLQRMAPTYGDIRLVVQDLANPVKLFEVIKMVCRITNTSERPVELTVMFESRSKQTAVLWNGISSRPLSKIEPFQHADVTISLIPVLPGLQTISGLRVMDLFLKRTYEYPDLAQIFVLPS